MITRLTLKQLFEYNQDTGEFIRKFSCGRGGEGSVAGRKNSRDGRIQIKISGKMYYAHRLAWLYMTGKWPKNEIDHKNHNGSDNRWHNLREATKSQNSQNQINGHAGAKSKKLGVYWHARNNRWCAQITVDRNQIYLGSFKSEEEASAAYLGAKTAMHPYGVSNV